MSEHPEQVLHWFTRARRFPRLIGKAPGGGAYPGGPYTMAQVIGASVFFVAGQQTQGLWGQWGFWIDNLILLAATVGVLFALRLFKPGGRDPFSTVIAVLRVASGPKYGRYQGRRIRLGRPHLVSHRVNAQVAPPATSTEVVDPDPVVLALEQSAQEPSSVSTEPAAAVGAGPVRGEDTVVAQLLAHVRTSG